MTFISEYTATYTQTYKDLLGENLFFLYSLLLLFYYSTPCGGAPPNMMTPTFREEEEDDPVPRSSNLGALTIVQHSP